MTGHENRQRPAGAEPVERVAVQVDRLWGGGAVMNTPNESVNPAVPDGKRDALPVAAPTRDVVRSGPIYDGELVDDLPAVNRRPVARRFMT